jgi:cytochrome c-type biogenesis protein CcmH/NrfG
MRLPVALLLAGLVSAQTPEPRPPAAKAAQRPELTPEQRQQLEAQRVRLQAAAAAAPEDPEPWRQLGLTHQALGDAVAAKGAFENVVALRPADAAGHFMLALALEKLQDPRAVVEWELCLRHAKDPRMAEAAKRHIKHLRGR